MGPNWKPASALLILLLHAHGIQAAPETQTVVVTGVRPSAESAEERRREAREVLDAVLAADIHKLPDLSVADALQRVSGVQVARDRGEASVFAVRGLTQVQTTLNGREIFTAGGGRTLDLADLPSEMLAGIDVYKSWSAEQVEGGMGGSVDLRTRRPFDFAGNAGVLSARGVRGQLVDRSAGQGSVLWSTRGRGDGSGEIGLLVNLVLQERAFREDQKTSGNPAPRTDLLPEQTVWVPIGTSETASAGKRRRSGASVVGQWRPAPGTEWTAELHFAELRTHQDSYQINAGPDKDSGVLPGSVELFDGTSDVRRVTWTNAAVSVLSFARDTLDRTRQAALAARHDEGDWTFSADFNHARSENRLFFSGPFLAARAAQFRHDFSGTMPATALAGTDLLDPANLHCTGLAYRVRPFRGELNSARADAQWRPAAATVERVAFGLRQAWRRAHDAPGLVFGDVSLNGPTADATPGRVQADPLAPTMDGRAPSLGNFLVGTLDDARDPVALRNAFGISTPLPQAGNPLGVWAIHERTDAAYAQADWRSGAWRGHGGLRVVRTHETVDGSQSVPSAATVAPLQVRHDYTDWLPSASLLWRPDAPWQLRAAASRTITRPNFDQLSPSLTLVPNSINPELNTGGAGNPALLPIRARNLDLAIESRAHGSPAWSATAFWKLVDGFITNASQWETWDGAVYKVSRPYNADPGRVRGVELAGLAFAGGAWRGLGLQANYTYVDSAVHDSRVNGELPLANLSRHAANLVGLLDQGPFSARLAWNWRSRFVTSVTTIGGVGTPVTMRAYGWLDGALRWRATERLTLSLEGANLLRTLRSSYNGVPTRPQGAWVNDRQWTLAMDFRL